MKQKPAVYGLMAILLVAFLWTGYQVKRSEMRGSEGGGGG